MKQVNLIAAEIFAAITEERENYLSVRPLYNDRDWQYFAELIINGRYKVILEKDYDLYTVQVYDTDVVVDTFERWGKTCPVYKTVGQGCFNYDPDTKTTKRWCKTVQKGCTFMIISLISEYENDNETVEDKMADVVANYQPECDKLIEAANEYHRRGNIELTKDYLERIKALCDHVLEVCSVISQCNMVPGDGFYPDLSELYITADGISLDDEIELLASKLAA